MSVISKNCIESRVITEIVMAIWHLEDADEKRLQEGEEVVIVIKSEFLIGKLDSADRKERKLVAQAVQKFSNQGFYFVTIFSSFIGDGIREHFLSVSLNPDATAVEFEIPLTLPLLAMAAGAGR